MAEVKHRCRLYLQFPAQPSAALATQLTQVIASSDVACVLLCHEESSLDEAPIGTVIDLVQSSGLACLIDGDAGLAERLGADGVHIEADAATYAEARKRLGESASIGAGCGLNRHDAMLLAELGADYVAFGTDANTIDAINQYTDIISWWSEIFVVPCVAWNVDNAEQAASLAALGADFIAPPMSIWAEDDPLRRIAEIDNAIRRSRRAA
jgi:thiamine-phosphate pyrophosphorylase